MVILAIPILVKTILLTQTPGALTPTQTPAVSATMVSSVARINHEGEDASPAPLAALPGPLRGIIALLLHDEPVLPRPRTVWAGSVWGSLGGAFFGFWALVLLAVPVTVMVGSLWAAVLGIPAFTSVGYVFMASGSSPGMILALPAAVIAGLLGAAVGVGLGVSYGIWTVGASAVYGAALTSLVGMAVDTVERIMVDHVPPDAVSCEDRVK